MARRGRKPGPQAPVDKTKTSRGRRLKIAGITDEAVVVAIVEARGMIQYAAEKLGILRNDLRDYIADHPVAAMALKEAREAMGDVAETKLFDLIEQGDVRCIMYYLSTVHKHRGYGVGRGAENPAAFASNQIYVEQINIVAVPPGQHLTPEEAKLPLVEEIVEQSRPAANGHRIRKLKPPSPPETPDCLQ